MGPRDPYEDVLYTTVSRTHCERLSSWGRATRCERVTTAGLDATGAWALRHPHKQQRDPPWVRQDTC